MPLWIWRDLRIRLPTDWEMLQFSRDPARGRCAFADRYRFRLEMDWQTVPAAPDFPRMIKDYEGKLEREGRLSQNRRVAEGTWQGFVGRQGDQAVSRFGHYFSEPSCMVELVMFWPRERETELERRILEGCELHREPNAAWRRWRAFGMDLRVPARLTLADCRVHTASAVMVFAGPRAPERWTFHRLGMVREWCRRPLAEWLAGQLPPQVVNSRTAVCERQGHTVVSAEGRYVPPGLLHRRGIYDTDAWICPRDGRLYRRECVRLHADVPAAEAALAVPGPGLMCCGGKGPGE